MSYYRERTAVRTFHLTDCLAGRGEFTGLDEFFRLAITSQLSRVLGRHEYNIAEKLTPIKEVVAWEESRNKHVPVDWHFTTADARVELYPTI
jgi:hypothetical protein